ncbi:MAG: nucleotidyltransferase family protein [Candidatus Omnitrophica bacterium]|nr:nucleotidyltransferase family protein [Candidatus Omnitrophota bacterium]
MSRSIRIGVIPAAGSGVRLGYLGKILPKCLLPVYDKPLLYYIIKNMSMGGVRKIYIIVNYKKELIFEYIRTDSNLFKNIKVKFIFQKELKGIAEAILLVKNFIDGPFITILGDDASFIFSLDNLVDLFYKKKAVVVEGIAKEKDSNILKNTCCLNIDREKRIIKIKEKPRSPFSNLRGTGIYIFRPEIFDYIENTPISNIRNEREITDTINLIASKKLAYVDFLKGINININSCSDLLNAWLVFRKMNLTFYDR